MIKINPSLWDSRKEPFFDDWETTPLDQKQFLIQKKLENYIEFSKKETPFYLNRLNEFKKNSDNPLSKIPPLLSSDLRFNLPPSGNSLLSSKTNQMTVFQSGGTTGTPKTSLFTDNELQQLDLPNARGFYALGLKPQDRVANLFAVGGLYMTYTHINQALQRYGCINFPFSNQTPPEFVKTVTELYNINCFTGITSVVLNCLRFIHQNSKKQLTIEKVFYGGEHIYPSDRDELRKKFNTSIIAAPGYGTVDTWYLGYQCLDCPPGVFHQHDDQCYLEIIDQHSGQACKADEIGMLYATAFPRRLTPIIRYQVGDLAKWIKSPCQCGRTTPLFKLLGRGDDVLRIGYDSIDYNFIQNLVSQVKGCTATVQMEKQRKEGKDLLILRVEVEFEKTHDQEKINELETLFIQNRPSFSEFLKKQTIWPLKIEFYPLRSIPLNTRTGKLIRVIDERVEKDEITGV